MSEKMFEIDFLTDKDNYYLASNNKKVLGKTDYEFDLSDIASVSYTHLDVYKRQVGWYREQRVY